MAIAELNPYRQQVQQTGQAAAQMSASATTLPDELRARLMEKFNYNKDLIDQQARAQTAYFSAPAEARLKYGTPGTEGYVLDPYKREALADQYTATQLGSYTGMTNLLGQRMGRIEDIIGAGGRAYQAKAGLANDLYGLAQQNYGQAFGEYKQQTGEQQFQKTFDYQQKKDQLDAAYNQADLQLKQQAAQTSQSQFEWQQPWQEKLWQYQLNEPYYKPESGGASSSTVDAMLQAILNQSNGTQVQGTQLQGSSNPQQTLDLLFGTLP